MLRTSFGKFAAIGVLALSGAVQADNVVKGFFTRPKTQIGLSGVLGAIGADSASHYVPKNLILLTRKERLAAIGTIQVPFGRNSWVANPHMTLDAGYLGKAYARPFFSTDDSNLLLHTGFVNVSVGATKKRGDFSVRGFVGPAVAVKKKEEYGAYGAVGFAGSYRFKGNQHVELKYTHLQSVTKESYAPIGLLTVGWHHNAA